MLLSRNDSIIIDRNSASLICHSSTTELYGDSNKRTFGDTSIIDYKDINTPVTEKDRDEPEEGAIRSGGTPNLFSREYIGLLINYASVGVVYGALPQCAYPFLLNYIGVDGPAYTSAVVLMSLPWSFKTFIGIITDSFPIFGYRRRPYIILGWSISLFFLLLMAFIPVGPPGHPEIGGKYVILMLFASLGYVISDVACDGIVVELAQREPEHKRGNIQTLIYITRTIFVGISSAFVGFTLNGKEYGGTFNWSLSFNWLMIILSISAFWSIPGSIFLLKDNKKERELFLSRCKEMWRIGKQRAVYQIMIFNFLNGLFYSFSATPYILIQHYWANVHPFNYSIFGVIGNIVFVIALYITKLYFLNINWRKLIFITTLCVVCIDMVVSFLTIYNIIRNQWFFLGVPILEYLPEGIRFIISTYVCVEIADNGYEAATYGLLTTIANLSNPFSTTLYNLINSVFDVRKLSIISDTLYVRNQVTYTFIIMYCMKLLSNIWLFLLPKQKNEARILKLKGGSNTKMGLITFIIAFIALLYSIIINILTIFPKTSCLRIAGGEGC